MNIEELLSSNPKFVQPNFLLNEVSLGLLLHACSILDYVINIDEWISIILGAISHMSMIQIFTYEYGTNGMYG